MKEIFEKIKFVEKLHAAGLLSDKQGAELLNIALYKNNFKNSQEPSVTQNLDISALYSNDARKNLKNFFDKNFKLNQKFDDKTFLKLIEGIEKQAVSAHEKQKDYEKNLQNSNSLAKEKLTSQAESQSAINPSQTKIYTREEIGNMSLEDYQKNESVIMEQLEKGLIA